MARPEPLIPNAIWRLGSWQSNTQGAKSLARCGSGSCRAILPAGPAVAARGQGVGS
jgi:hypothetical protein